jgi:hypothetical protein
MSYFHENATFPFFAQQKTFFLNKLFKLCSFNGENTFR